MILLHAFLRCSTVSEAHHSQRPWGSPAHPPHCWHLDQEWIHSMLSVALLWITGELQKQITHDAVEDVIKCLRSSIKNGVVPGCQLSIIKAIDDIHVEYELENSILQLIKDACIATYTRVLKGPEGNGLDYFNKSADEIIGESIKQFKVFDLENCCYTSDIITSAETDTMVLTAASELIKILTSGNQCVFLDSDVNNSHQDEVNVYA